MIEVFRFLDLFFVVFNGLGDSGCGFILILVIYSGNDVIIMYNLNGSLGLIVLVFVVSFYELINDDFVIIVNLISVLYVVFDKIVLIFVLIFVGIVKLWSY